MVDPHIKNRLNGWTLERLFAAADEMAALMAQPGWATVQEILEAEVSEIDRKLDGRPLEHVEYAHTHGRRGGLREAWNVALAIRQVADLKRQEQQAKHEGSPEREPVRS